MAFPVLTAFVWTTFTCLRLLVAAFFVTGERRLRVAITRPLSALQSAGP